MCQTGHSKDIRQLCFYFKFIYISLQEGSVLVQKEQQQTYGKLSKMHSRNLL